MQTISTLHIGLVPIKTIDCILFFDISQIILCTANCKHTHIYTKGQQKAIICISPLSFIEEMLLPSEFFFKCHRSHIINLMHLKKLDKSGCKVHLTDSLLVNIAEERMPEFIKLIDPFQRKK